MKRVRTVAVAAAALLSAPFDAHGQASTTPTTTAVAVPPGATVFSPVPPCRLLDTRSSQALRANETVQTMAHGRCAVPATATAVAVTLTAVGPQAGGHLTLHPEQQRPDASHLNVMAGDIRANGALIQLGRDGQLRVTSSVPTHVLIDVSGYFTPVDGPATAGRFVPLTPRRVTDTRSGPVPTPRSSVRVNPNVPAGAIAVAVNITTDNAQAGDYFTAYPAGAARPTASVLNVDGAGRTRAAGVVIPLAGGAFDVYTHHGSHVIVDVTGYVTGATSEPSVDGLFVPTEPRRLIDTRQAEQGPRLYARATRDVTTTPVVAGQAAAIAANVTITDTFGTGWWLTHPLRA